MVTIESLLLTNIYTFCYLSLIVLYTFVGFAKCMSLQYHTKYCHCSENPLHSTYSSSPFWPLNLWKPLIILFLSFAFPKSHAIWRLGIIYHIVFPHWLLPLINMHLSFLHTSSWLDDSFLFSPEFWHILYKHGAIIVISRLTIYPSFTKVALFYFWKLIDQDFDFEKFEVYQKTEWKYSEFPSFLTHSPNLPHYYHFLLV